MIPDEFVRLAELLADTAREVPRRTSNEPEVEIKADGTPVTALDRAVEAELRGRTSMILQSGHRDTSLPRPRGVISLRHHR